MDDIDLNLIGLVLLIVITITLLTNTINAWKNSDSGSNFLTCYYTSPLFCIAIFLAALGLFIEMFK